MSDYPKAIETAARALCEKKNWQPDQPIKFHPDSTPKKTIVLKRRWEEVAEDVSFVLNAVREWERAQ